MLVSTLARPIDNTLMTQSVTKDLAITTAIPIGGSLSNGSPILNLFFNKTVGIITAADPNPQSQGPIAQRFFEARGIKNIWIKVFFPCRTKVHDPAFVAEIDRVDVIYFTGGYSDKLQECMFGDSTNGDSNPVLDAIRKKGIVSGSSAGAMVQPKGNILLTRQSIDSYLAIVRRSNPIGLHAFNLFQGGLIDVHFSERGRQGRLWVLNVQTKTRFSFGIDEDTAIIENQMTGHLTVVGARGVVIFDNQHHDLRQGIMHYLSNGDTFNLKTGAVMYPEWKKSCLLSSVAPRESTNVFMDFRRISLEVAKYNTSVNFRHRSIVGRSPIVEVIFQKVPATRYVCGKFNNTEYLSFSDMHVEMGTTNIETVGYYGDIPVNLEPTYIDI